MDFKSMKNDDLSAALKEKRDAASALFALTEPTIEQVNEAEALVASIGEIEDVQATRAEAVKDAEKRFAAARATFSADGAEDDEIEDDGDEDEDEADEAEDESVEASVEDDTTETDEDDEGDDGETVEAAADSDEEDDNPKKKEKETVAAAVNHTTSQTVKAGSVARKVGRKTKRPEVKASGSVQITAAADVQGFSTGQRLDGMEQVTEALLSRGKGFNRWNEGAARAVASQSGGAEVLHKFGVASFTASMDSSLVQTKGNEYAAIKNAIKARAGSGDTLTAAGWCAPSETIYSYIADYVVDGLVTVPEVGSPRGGLMLTTGPAKVTQGDAALDAFGFVQTEAQAEAGTVKTCEVIECPEFTDHRLDAIGYCYKIPFLTQHAYPEIVTDALRLANVMYAHKVNARVLKDLVRLSDARTANGIGASVTDTLEALTLIAVAERRKWNIGENAVMEVKLPVIAREVFRSDMSRRTGLALTDIATDQKIDAEFTSRRLAVEYVSDWQEISATNPVMPSEIKALIYPAGTFIKAVEDVVNLSAVYDAASLSVNEYTGVFFEQGILVAKAGYGSNVVTIPVCSAGMTGAAALICGTGGGSI